jgi:Secretion system C-terminal sorting domain
MMKLRILSLAILTAYTSSAQKIWDGPSTGGSWATATNWNNNTLPVANDIVIFPTGISGTISNVNSGNNITLGGLIVQGNSNITLTNTSSRTVTIANGTGASDFSIDAAATLTMGTNVNISLAAGTSTNNTTANINGLLLISTGRTYNTNSGNVLTTVGGTIQNAGTVTSNAARLLFSNGSMYIHDRAGGNIPNATWNTNSTCKVTGLTGADAGNDNQAFGNLVYDCPGMTGTTRILGASGLSVAGNLEIINTGAAVLVQGLTPLTVGGNLVLKGGVFRIGDNTDRILDVTGNVSVEGATLQMSTGNNAADRGILNVAGNFSQSAGTITETLNGRGVVNFNGNTIQSFSKNVLATVSNNIDFTINGGSSVDFGSSVLNGSTGTFTVSNNARIITANADGFYSTGNNGTIQVGGVRTYSSTADYEFRGTHTGIFTTSTNPQVRNLIVNNNTTGNVVMSQPMTVNGVLTLTAGLLTTSATNLLTISATGSASAATNTSFVNGPMAKVFAAPLTGFTFPVGKSGTGFRNIGITAPSGASTFRAEFFRALPPAGILGTGITQLSACEYWDLSRTAGAASVSTRVILSWETNSVCGSLQYVTQISTLKVAHLTGGTWVNEGYQSTTGTNSSGTITSGNAINTFSPFALAGSGPADNPLAVLFSNIKAYENNGGIQIEWSNMTEKDMANYFVERSVNGRDFIVIGQRLPRSNQNEKVSYNAFDPAPAPGSNFYRIRAMETTGKIVYSKVMNVNLMDIKKGLALYPNPVSGRVITIGLAGIKRGQYNLRIVSVTGKDIHKETIFSEGNTLTQTLDLPMSVKAGLYSIIITGEDYRESKSFIVQ